jgi:CubicO group peptidase (beta-lactamase class C family)
MYQTRLHRRHLILLGTGAFVMTQTATVASAAPFDWTAVSPAEAGFAPDLAARLDAALAAGRLPNLHGVIVVRGGKLVLERYQPGADMSWNRSLGVVAFRPDTLHDLRSVTKSITGLVYGIALAQGKVPAPEAKLMPLFPQYPDLAADPARQHLTVGHVLGMTMGTDWDELSIPYTNPANSEIAMERAADRYRFILERKIMGEAGVRWTYNGGATALLGALIARGTGQSLPDFVRAALFEPLGIGAFEWMRGADNTPSAASGLRMTPRDLARIGQMVLQKGKWQGTTVVPSSWLDAALQPRVAIEAWGVSYGYQWYVGKTPTGVRWVGAMGNGGQRLYVLPELDLVVVTTFGNYDTPDQGRPPITLLAEVVLPALRG